MSALLSNGIDALAGLRLDAGEQARHIVAFVECGLHLRAVVQADVGHVCEVAPAEFLEQPCFADLPRAVQNQWFAALAVFRSTSLLIRKRSMPALSGCALRAGRL